MPIIQSNPIFKKLGAGLAPGKAFFNGTTMETVPLPTLEQQNEKQRAHERFTSTTRSVVDELLNTQAETAKLDKDTEAAQFSAKGYQGEVDQYNAAAQTATSNADLAGENAKLQAFQSARALMTTVGAQQASVAGAGFKDSGSALYLAKSSYQKGNLEQQIDVLNGNLKSGGYLEQAAANRAEASAAGVASNAALALAAADASAANTSRTNAGNLSTALGTYLNSVDPNSLTPEDALTTSLLSANPDAALAGTAAKLQSTEKNNALNVDQVAGGGTAPFFNGSQFVSGM